MPELNSNSIDLNTEQLNALEDMSGFCRNVKNENLPPEQRMMSFSGPAGTGKTTTIMELLLWNEEYISVYLCATTNRAAKNLGDNIGTIFKLLGLFIKMNEATGEFDIHQRSNWKPIRNAIIVVDESSMLTKNVMAYILHLAKAFNLGFIFVGDRYQLPAVGDGYDVFDGSIPMVELTQIMRQSRDNPIQAWGQYIRDCIKESRSVEPLTNHIHDTGGLHHISRDAALIAMTRGAKEGAGDFSVAFTNKTVDTLNIMMREGDFLARPPFEDEVLTTGDAITVSRRGESGKFENQVIATSNSFPVYRMTGDDRTLDDVDGLGVEILSEYDEEWIGGLIPTNLPQYLNSLADLKQDALVHKTGDDKRAAWRRYYNFRGTFFDLRPCFAGTVHKAQGCTFNNVYVDMNDLQIARHVGDPSKREDVYSRLLYVAITRARNNVYFYDN